MIEDLAQEAVKRSLSPGARVTERQAALDAAREAVKLAGSAEPPAPDVRPSAFVAAWERIEAAQKLKKRLAPKNRVAPEALPDLYWSLMAEAQIYADLARTDETTGRGAGALIVEQNQLKQGERERMEAVFSVARDRQRDVARVVADKPMRLPGEPKSDMLAEPPFAAGQRVRILPPNLPALTGCFATVIETRSSGTVIIDCDARTGGPRQVAVLPADIELLPPPANDGIVDEEVIEDDHVCFEGCAEIAPFTVGHRVRITEPQHHCFGRIGVIRSVEGSKTADPRGAALNVQVDTHMSTWVSARDVEPVTL